MTRDDIDRDIALDRYDQDHDLDEDDAMSARDLIKAASVHVAAILAQHISPDDIGDLTVNRHAIGMQDASTRTIITRKASMYEFNGTTISLDGKPIAELLEGVELEAGGILVSKANGFDKDEALLEHLDAVISRRNDP